MTRIKICGITNLADARYAAGAGADYLGFIQHPDSPRYVDAGRAAEIIEWLYGPETVGVFVNLESDDMNRLAEQAGFDYVQMHGEESPETCAAVDAPVIKAIRIGDRQTDQTPGKAVCTPDDLFRTIDRYGPHVSHFLFDTWDADAFGGTGRRFDWTLLESLPSDIKWFLAGGITVESIANAIGSLHPFGVDISSGVETEPGVKDFDLIDAFIDTVRQTNPAHASRERGQGW